MSCGCTDCACNVLPNDVRFADQLPRYGACEVIACHMGPDAPTYVVTVRSPDGRQRTRLACVKHLQDAAGACLSGVRIESFE